MHFKKKSRNVEIVWFFLRNIQSFLHSLFTSPISDNFTTKRQIIPLLLKQILKQARRFVEAVMCAVWCRKRSTCQRCSRHFDFFLDVHNENKKKTSNVIFFSPLALILVHNLHMYHNFILIFSFYLIVETVVGISTFDTLDTIGVYQQWKTNQFCSFT